LQTQPTFIAVLTPIKLQTTKFSTWVRVLIDHMTMSLVIRVSAIATAQKLLQLGSNCPQLSTLAAVLCGIILSQSQFSWKVVAAASSMMGAQQQQQLLLLLLLGDGEPPQWATH
jgi:hypothetical protein